MADIAWPTTLPQGPSSYSEKPQPVAIRSAVENGPVKRRRRFTKAVNSGSMSFLLTIPQRNILKQFFDEELDGGVNRCMFLNPWTGEVMPYIFKEPQQGNEGALGVNVTIEFDYY